MPLKFTDHIRVSFLLFSVHFISCHEQRDRGLTEKNKLDELVLSDSTKYVDAFEFRSDTAAFNIDKGKLSGEIQKLKLSYAAVSCPCAQWFETKYEGSFDSPRRYYLEPANNNLIVADDLFNGSDLPVRIEVIGQFYSKEGFPKDYRPVKEDPIPKKVFRYTKIKIIKIGANQ